MRSLKFLPMQRRAYLSASSPVSFVLGIAIAGLAGWFLWSGSREATAQAPPSRIGVVDFQRILRESVAGKASITRLKAIQDDRMAKAKVMTDELRRLEAESKNPALPAAQRSAAEQRINEKQLAMKRFAEDADKDIGGLRDRELQSLQGRIKPVIDAVGREMGMAAIFNKYESGLVYASDAIDLTSAVVTRFNAAPPAPASTAVPRN